VPLNDRQPITVEQKASALFRNTELPVIHVEMIHWPSSTSSSVMDVVVVLLMMIGTGEVLDKCWLVAWRTDSDGQFAPHLIGYKFWLLDLCSFVRHTLSLPVNYSDIHTGTTLNLEPVAFSIGLLQTLPM